MANIFISFITYIIKKYTVYILFNINCAYLREERLDTINYLLDLSGVLLNPVVKRAEVVKCKPILF